MVHDVTEEVKKSKIYFLSLVGTNANEHNGKGLPRSALYFYDVKSGMELRKHGIHFLSAQDLKCFHDEQKKKIGSNDVEDNQLNVYQLVHYFMEHRPDAYYFLDEVPLIKGMKS